MNQSSLSSYHLQRLFRNGVPLRPEIYPPSWRANNSSPAASSQYFLDKPSALNSIHSTVTCAESLDKSSGYYTLFQHESPLCLSASTSPGASGAKPMDKSSSHSVNCIFILLEPPCCLQPIFRWQCKTLPLTSCPQPVDAPSTLAPIPSCIPSFSASHLFPMSQLSSSKLTSLS